MKNPKVLIIPDVHGRTFWKEAINKYPIEQYPDLNIVFLGDYLDPYVDYDGISQEQAFDNFKEILKYKDKDNRITLLIGNHDWHYFVNLDTCRLDFKREKEIKELFIDNLNKFHVTYEIELDGCKYLFSHAGITQGWLNDVAESAKSKLAKYKNAGTIGQDLDYNLKLTWLTDMSIINKTKVFHLLEDCLQCYNDPFYSCVLSMISHERGGYNPYGSCIWADVHEHIWAEDLNGYYQIFAHTYSYPNYDTKAYVISQDGHCWAMLDCGQAFIMDIEGNIEKI